MTHDTDDQQPPPTHSTPGTLSRRRTVLRQWVGRREPAQPPRTRRRDETFKGYFVEEFARRIRWQTGLSVRTFGLLCAAILALTLVTLTLENHKRPAARTAAQNTAQALQARIDDTLRSQRESVLGTAQLTALNALRVSGYTPGANADLQAVGELLVAVYPGPGDPAATPDRTLAYLYIQPGRIRVCGRSFLLAAPEVPYTSYTSDQCVDLAEPTRRALPRGETADGTERVVVSLIRPS